MSAIATICVKGRRMKMEPKPPPHRADNDNGVVDPRTALAVLIAQLSDQATKDLLGFVEAWIATTPTTSALVLLGLCLPT